MDGIIPSRRRSLASGDLLFRQGDPTAGAFRVVSGAVRLERKTLDGRLVVVHRAQAGDVLAEASLFAPAYHCDAVAIRATVVEVLDRAAVMAALRTDPDAAAAMLARMARQLQAARLRLELRDVRPARERVRRHLAVEADPAGAVRIDGPLQDRAAEIGLSREAYYRALAALERDGLIERLPGAIRLLPRPGA